MGWRDKRQLERWAQFNVVKNGHILAKKTGLYCVTCGSNRLKLYDAMHGLRWYRCERCGQKILYDKTDPIRPTSSALTGRDGKIKPYKPFKRGLIEVPHLRRLGYKED
jgi:DNA-directed RNA polymerase subunit RPC12/RpoP